MAMFKCRGCGAVLSSTEDGPTLDDLSHSRLPEDCNEAVPVVVLEEYLSCEAGPWDEDDLGRWSWSDP